MAESFRCIVYSVLTAATSAKLPGHFMSWLSSPEAAFLKGKLVWANWDVEELKVASAKIQEGSLLTVGMQGWPYTSLV